MPIAVVPFGWESAGAAPFDVAEVVAADLQRSGRFAPLDRKDMIDRPTAGDQIRFQDWRYLKSDFIVVGKLTPEGARSLRGHVRAVQRAQRPAPDRAAPDGDDQLAACDGAPDRRHDLRAAHRHPRRVLDAHRVRQRRGHAAEAAVHADRVGRRRREPAEDRQLERADHVAGVVAGRARASRTCRSRAKRPPSTCRRCARASAARVSARAGINGAPTWSPDGGTLALTLSRKDGDVDIYTLKLSSQVLTRMTFDPGIDTEPSWSADGRKLYFMSDRAGGPQIYEVDVAQPNRATRVTFEGTYNARPRLSPDGKQLAVVHLDRGNYRIADRRPAVERRAGAVAGPAGREPELRAERRHAHLRDAGSRPRRAGDGVGRRPGAAAPRKRAPATCASPCGRRSRPGQVSLHRRAHGRRCSRLCGRISRGFCRSYRFDFRPVRRRGECV